MSQFTVRVELHNAIGEDYEVLHSAMQKEGFVRVITSDDGHTYHLPWAEYTATGNVSTARVRDIARAAANTTGRGMPSSSRRQIAAPG